MGAAIATLISYVLQAWALAMIARRVYPVPYETNRLLTIVVSAAAAYAISLLLPSGMWGVMGRIALTGLFFLLLYALRFFKPGELQAVATLLRRRTPVAPAGSPPPPPPAE
jgi:hypothetical protein